MATDPEQILLEAFRKMEQCYEWPMDESDPRVDTYGYYAPSINEVARVAVKALRDAGALSGPSAYRQALGEIVNLLGPDRICDCSEEGCEGLRFEAAESLRIARIALSGARP